MDVLTIILIVALAVALAIIIVSLARRKSTDDDDDAGGSIVATLVKWFTTYAMRWNKLSFEPALDPAVRRVPSHGN